MTDFSSSGLRKTVIYPIKSKTLIFNQTRHSKRKSFWLTGKSLCFNFHKNNKNSFTDCVEISKSKNIKNAATTEH